MTADYRPEPHQDPRREVVQLIPDHTSKIARLHSEIGLCGYEERDLVGWAVVVTFRAGELPEISVEPVVDDDCMGPVPLGDLMEEAGPLTLLEIL
ncbi:hypothetical protein DMB38_20135 [Streptomyces sp. WAC 06738]|uniref:hypothetical protein n=1 Tax=Streptomyces sp. WAC 06738 TaxID=2203210 RepID=UPI000F6D2C6A|nr:hypothetical protein [Streptomyces sp. WAC 06738]AZM47788.1 hypothetical protein DMB38_20135 [Streptomyces sp. WAC 06738]